MKYWLRRALVVLTLLAAVASVGVGGWMITKDGHIDVDPGTGASDEFVPGFHDARTGESWADMTAAPGVTDPQTWAVMIIEYSVSCGACHAYVDEVIMAWMALNQEWPGRLVVVLVNVDESSDKAILAFAKDHGVPDPILLGGGVDISHSAPGVPETFVFGRDPLASDPKQEWTGVANFTGGIDADTIVKNVGVMFKSVEKYLDGE